MRKLLLSTLILGCLSGYAQRFKSDNSHIRFFSEAPLEDIAAVNESASSIIDAEKMVIVIIVPIKSFSFQKKLMQEHFNENYLESDQYPNATFKGKLLDWNGSTTGETDARAKGTMEIHGVEQEMTIKGILDYSDEELSLEAVFPIKLADYNIKIPKAVFYKIAEEVEVTAKFQYKPYEKN